MLKDPSVIHRETLSNFGRPHVSAYVTWRRRAADPLTDLKFSHALIQLQ
jgi:hypothetical protein